MSVDETMGQKGGTDTGAYYFMHFGKAIDSGKLGANGINFTVNFTN